MLIQNFFTLSLLLIGWVVDDATSFTISTIAWLTATQLLASAMGGYLAGRLHTKWVETHTD